MNRFDGMGRAELIAALQTSEARVALLETYKAECEWIAEQLGKRPRESRAEMILRIKRELQIQTTTTPAPVEPYFHADPNHPNASRDGFMCRTCGQSPKAHRQIDGRTVCPTEPL